MCSRVATIQRKTAETDIELTLAIDGSGATAIETGIGALDHFLHLFARHGQFDLTVQAVGDLHVDAHHTAEDVAICLGQALRSALGDHKGLCRYGTATVPMDEALACVAVDCGGRSWYVQRNPLLPQPIGQLDSDLVRHFWDTVTREARITAHVVELYGTNSHHQAEAMFKAFGRALDAATQIDPRIADRLPSTKEHIEGGS